MPPFGIFVEIEVHVFEIFAVVFLDVAFQLFYEAALSVFALRQQIHPEYSLVFADYLRQMFLEDFVGELIAAR